MIKALLTTTVVTLVASFAQANWENVPAERLDDYKRAVSEGLAGHKMSCTNYITYEDGKQTVNENFGFNWKLYQEAIYGMINSSGVQPVIRLGYAKASDNTTSYNWDYYITTSPDYLKIVGVRLVFVTSRTVTEQVNRGTILNPDYRTEEIVYQKTETVICQ